MANLAAFVKTGKLNDLFVKKGKFARTVEWTLSLAIKPETQEKMNQQLDIIIKNVQEKMKQQLDIKIKNVSSPRNYSLKTTTMLLAGFIELIPLVYFTYYPIEKCMTAQIDKTMQHCWTLSPLPVAPKYIAIKLIIQNMLRFTTSSTFLEGLNMGFTFFQNRNLELVYGISCARFIEKNIIELCDFLTVISTEYGHYLIGICVVIGAAACLGNPRLNKAQPEEKTGGLSIIEGVMTEQELKDLDEQYEKFKIFCTETLGLSEKLALEWNEQFYNFYKPCTELTKTLFAGII